jgi:hypothetical protein
VPQLNIGELVSGNRNLRGSEAIAAGEANDPRTRKVPRIEDSTAKKERPSRPLQNGAQVPEETAYFGVDVVVVVELPFLLFLPPLWALLVLVAFLPVSAVLVLGGVWVSVPPPVWANARLPASSIVHTTVKSFFMQSPLKGKFRVIQSNPILKEKF